MLQQRCSQLACPSGTNSTLSRSSPTPNDAALTAECWACNRLVHKQYRDYDEAVKCYKNALRMDKESQQVLRDLAGLQVSTSLWYSDAPPDGIMCPCPIPTSVVARHRSQIEVWALATICHRPERTAE